MASEQNRIFIVLPDNKHTNDVNRELFRPEASKNPKVFKSRCSLFIINQAVNNKRLQIEF